MIILGINASHNATACLLIDGKIVYCVSEERISRIKNQYGLPTRAVRDILKLNQIKSSQVDMVVFGYNDPKVNTEFSLLGGKNLPPGFLQFLWKIKEEMLVRIPQTRHLYDKSLNLFYGYFIDPKKEEELLANVKKNFGVPKNKVVRIDHHLAHAYSALYANPDKNKKDWLILTFDAMGDELCSTVSIYKKGEFERLAATTSGNSLGDLYGMITEHFGMKGGEHEYKVMGLAPYANEKHAESVYQKLKQLVWINPDMTFSTTIHSHMFYKILPKILYKERFDNIAAGLQKLTEEILIDWVKLCVKKTGIKNVACAGGLFMNVKANQKILELPEVAGLFVMPSCGDESTAIGAAYWGYEQEKLEDTSLPEIESLGPLYLGKEFSDKEIRRELGKKQNRKYKINKFVNIEKTIAKLLSSGEVVARFNGRMEWGARALGNRSILANPANLDVVRMINDQIKSRDFWMPFAPSIMKEKAGKYMVARKKIEAPYMIITFDATPLGRKDFKAAMHQYDFTLRPQMVDKDWNPGYWKVLKEFEKLTGIGGVLNTSFNLHGYPIVYTPKDALYVFENSGLKYLAIGNYLVSKLK